jgi:hypothetical protein
MADYGFGNPEIIEEEVDIVVKEPHCLGHQEPHTQTVREYRQAQGVELYDEMNREWRDIILKEPSAGPTVGKPSDRSFELFDRCSYDVDSFRDFVASPGFQDVFDLDPETSDRIRRDEDALLQFAFRFLRQVLFGEQTIPLRQGARERRVERAWERLLERQADMAATAEQETDKRYESE